MSNRLFQSVIHQMKDSLDRCIGVVDNSGTIVACSELGKIGDSLEPGEILNVFDSSSGAVVGQSSYKCFGSKVHPEYAVFVEGKDPNAAVFASILATAISNIKSSYDEKYNRADFIKNVILDNILPGDVSIKSRELHFDQDECRVVFLVRILDADTVTAYDTIDSLFPDKENDFVLNVSDTDIVIVKQVYSDYENEDLENLARSVADSLGTEYYTHTFVGIGSVKTGIKELAHSFKEAQVALEVGKVFDNDRTIISYDNLGIARLIYQLPSKLCNSFLNEVFKRGSIDTLDNETLFTIQKFFENNLNVSETSRKLFVHRNTLVYRLEKIRKLTGLDLREFDDAIVFKVALMVKKYLDSSPIKF